MKPDKHKKEKNAAYKKKHGISDVNRQEKRADVTNEGNRELLAKNDKTRPAKDEMRACAVIRDGDRENERSGKGTHEKVQNTYQSAEAELETSGTKSYHKRKLVSNWERYEVEEESAPALRGSDFVELLKSKANVLSHLQYRDELGLNEETSKQTGCSKFFSLDCDDLAQSLMCIPLHQRLNINVSVFEPNLIQRCFKLSDESASHYAISIDDGSAEDISTCNASKNNFANKFEKTTDKCNCDIMDHKEIDETLPTKIRLDEPGQLIVKSTNNLDSNLSTNAASSDTVPEVVQPVLGKPSKMEALEEQIVSSKINCNTVKLKDETKTSENKTNIERNKQSLEELENELDQLLMM